MRFDVKLHLNTTQNASTRIEGPTSKKLRKENIVCYLNFVLEVGAMPTCDYSNPFRVSIFKYKYFKFPWFDFAYFWPHTGSNSCLSCKLSEPIGTFHRFRDICLPNLPTIFHTGSFVGLNFGRISLVFLVF